LIGLTKPVILDLKTFWRFIMQHTLIAVFDNRSDAQGAMAKLLSSGFSQSEVRLNEDRNNAANTASSAGGSGSMESEGVGASIKHFLNDLFGDESDTTHRQIYSNAIEHGHHTLTVTATDEAEVERAADIVERFGPIDIDEKAAEWGGATQAQPPVMGSDRAYSVGNSQDAGLVGSQQRDVNGGAAIPIVQEQLKVGKREVQRGGVRVYSRIVETPVQENVSLREEHVHVERRPVDQLIEADNTLAFKEQTIELRETGEEAVIQKTARVVEEVVVSKDVTQRQESINDTVRHTEVEIEQLGTQTTGNDTAYRTHWTSNYATTGKKYEDYAPAYSYGSDMANQYRGRQWNDVESDLRSTWESRNAGGASTWEQFKGAVRHGWDSITK
jgi:uncharacterized protein (TIGR02271 family)